MPPLPPTGMFDVRYSSNRKAEKLKDNNQTIEMRGLVYPVTVRVEKMGIKLEDETGKRLSERIKSGEEVVISNSAVSKLKVTGDIIPEEYSLGTELSEPIQSKYKDRILDTRRCKQCNVNDIQCIRPKSSRTSKLQTRGW